MHLLLKNPLKQKISRTSYQKLTSHQNQMRLHYPQGKDFLMTELCASHPTRSAWWQCPNCTTYLCPQCIVHRKGGYSGSDDYFLCPKCHIQAAQLDTSNFIEPFWRRLHKFFVYPFSSIQSIILIFGLALLSTLFTKSGLIGVFLRLIPWALMVKYSFEALRATSEGNFKPPALSSNTLSENIDIVFKQIVLFIALNLIFFLFIAQMNPFFWIIFGAVIIIGLPAMIIILAINEDLGQALNPVYFLGMAIRIGWGYLLLLFFLALLMIAPSALGYAIIRHMPESTQLYLWMAAKNYYTLVAYHLMGWMILQYHEKISYQISIATLLASVFSEVKKEQKSPHEAPPAASREAALLVEVAPLIQEGNLDGAIAVIQRETDPLRISDLQLSERYVNLLTMRQRNEELDGYIPHHLDLLIKADQKDKAMELYSVCMSKDNFTATPLALFRIASWFNEKGDPKNAVQTLNLLTKSHPQDTLVPKAYFRAAQILHEKLMNTEKAKKVLSALINKYPQHEIASFARNYLEGI